MDIISNSPPRFKRFIHKFILICAHSQSKAISDIDDLYPAVRRVSFSFVLFFLFSVISLSHHSCNNNSVEMCSPVKYCGLREDLSWQIQLKLEVTSNLDMLSVSSILWLVVKRFIIWVIRYCVSSLKHTLKDPSTYKQDYDNSNLGSNWMRNHFSFNPDLYMDSGQINRTMCAMVSQLKCGEKTINNTYKIFIFRI